MLYSDKCIEREFDIEVIASLVEVCSLTDTKDILDFCSFLIGKDINSIQELSELSECILYILKGQYPDLKRSIFLANGDILSDEGVKYIIDKYKSKYGEKIKIKGFNNSRNRILELKNINK